MRVVTRVAFVLMLLCVLVFGAFSATAHAGENYHGYETISTLPINLDSSQLLGVDDVIKKFEELPESAVDKRKLLVKDKRETFWRLLALPEGSDIVAVIRKFWNTGVVESIQLNIIHKTEGADVSASVVAIKPLDEIYKKSPLPSWLSGSGFVSATGLGQNGAIHVITCTVPFGQNVCTLFIGWAVQGTSQVLLTINNEDWKVTAETIAGDSVDLSEGTYTFSLYAYDNGRRGALLASKTVVVDAALYGSIGVKTCRVPKGEELCELRATWTARGTNAVWVRINGTLWTWAPANSSDSIMVPAGTYKFDLYDEDGGEQGVFLDSETVRVFFESDSGGEPAAGSIPNDPGYKYQKFLQMIGMEPVWKKFGFNLGGGVKIGVADSGLICSELRDANGTLLAKPHPDIDCGRVFMLYDAIGFDDNPGPEINNPRINYHGTFVTAIMAAQTDNGIGGSGIAPDATYYICRAIGESGSGSTFSLTQCITKFQENGVDIVNMSVGSSFDDPFLRLAILNATNSGMTIVAASGNTGGEILFPAAIDEVISVGSLDFDKIRSSYSSFGEKLDLVGVCGDLDRTEFKNHGAVAEGFHEDQTVYGMYILNGTSFCAPQVTAALAVLYGLGFSPDKANERIFSGIEDVLIEGRDPESGYGMLRIDRAVGASGSGE